jgi:hypothetical protein
LWSEEDGTVIPTPETHNGPNHTFVPFHIDPFQHNGEIFPKKTKKFGLTGLDHKRKLIINGLTVDSKGRRFIAIGTKGVWVATVQIAATVNAQKEKRTEKFSFDWDGARITVKDWPS